MTEVRVGFVATADCAPVIAAALLGFDRRHGVRILLSRESSWAGLRDKLIAGDLDAAHLPYGLVYGAHMGIDGCRADMAVLMALSRNGQGIALSSRLKAQGVSDGATLARQVENGWRDHVFAHTGASGTQAMWLYYWLAAHGIHPLRDVRTIVVPPALMVANLRAGTMDGFCAGDPWSARAVADGVGCTVATSEDIWPDHPEKVLGCTAAFVRERPDVALALLTAVLDAARHVDDPAHQAEVVRLISGKACLDVSEQCLLVRAPVPGRRGRARLRFFNDGETCFPYLSDGMWFLTQQRRWGLLRHEPDYLAVAGAINQVGLYREAATQLGVPLPSDSLRSSRLIDGGIWDGRHPEAYAAGFAITAASETGRAPRNWAPDMAGMGKVGQSC
ncbi:MAG: CmpA/NrtA family ABC transporter substrate-binding protein [Perlucidibaca sp.]